MTRLFERGCPREAWTEQKILEDVEVRMFGRATDATSLARYVVLERLGAGGGGVVYRAYDPKLDREVAIKLLRTSACPSSDGDARVRLLREAQALAKLSHPNVVHVFDVGAYDERDVLRLNTDECDHELTPSSGVMMVMELCEGQTLTQWLWAEPRSPEAIVRVFQSIARGLAAAHERGLVHRDVKPANVIIGRDGRVRVLDFGLARPSGSVSLEPSGATPDDFSSTSASALATTVTQTGAVLGTPLYMAPEQHRGCAADERSDQYAFCVTLYHALFGQAPFRGRSLTELLRSKEDQRPLRAPGRRKVPRWLDRVIMRGLCPRPGDRFASMHEVLEALDRKPRSRSARRLATGAAIALSLAVGWVANGLWSTPTAGEPSAATCQAQSADTLALEPP